MKVTFKIPPALMIVIVAGKEYRIIKFENEILTFESDEILTDFAEVKITCFDFKKYAYNEMMIQNTVSQNKEQSAFAYYYDIKFDKDSEDYKKLAEYIDIVEQMIANKEAIKDLINVSDEKIYPVEKERMFSESYDAQIKQWYGDTLEKANLTSVDTRNIEMAFALNNYNLYNQVLAEDINAVIKKTLASKDLDKHPLFKNGFNRLYIGNEFCHNLLPNKNDLFNILEKAHKESYEVTITFTYMRDYLVSYYKSLIDELYNWGKDHNKKLEVVVNDWGMLKWFLDKEDYLEPILGILLNKRKKDPRFKWKLGSEQYPLGRIKSNVNSSYFIEIMKKHNMHRFEFESIPEYAEIPKGKHSLHFPFYQTNTSQYCPLYAECKNFNRSEQAIVKQCPKYCGEYVFLYAKHLDLIGKYNSIFAYNPSVLINQNYLNTYLDAGIDRLVYSD